MKKIVTMFLLCSVLALLAESCQSSGHKSQSWAPKTGKKMKAGHNR